MGKGHQSQFLTLMWKRWIEFTGRPITILSSYVIVPYLVIVSPLLYLTYESSGSSSNWPFKRKEQAAAFGVIANPLEHCSDLRKYLRGVLSPMLELNGSSQGLSELAYAPNDRFTNQVFADIAEEYNYTINVKGFPNERAVRDYVKENRLASMIYVNRHSNVIDITVPEPANQGSFDTSKDWKPLLAFTKENFNETSFCHFLNLEGVLTDAMLRELNVDNVTRAEWIRRWKLGAFPSPKIVTFHPHEWFLVFYVLMVIGTLSLASNSAKIMIDEKYTGGKEYMKIAGMSEMIYWLTWQLRFAVLQIPLSLLLVVTFRVVYSVVICSNAFLMFVMFSLYQMSLAAYVTMVSSFCSNSTIASVTIVMSWLLLTLAAIGFGTEVHPLLRLLLMLFSGYSFYGVNTSLLTLDYLNLGLTWKHLFQHPFLNVLPAGFYMLSMIFDIFLYVAIAWYVSNIKPGKHGTRKHPCFCFIPSKKVEGDVANEAHVMRFPELIEREDPNEKAAIDIVNLVKKYKNSKVVKGINLKAFKNQIFVLLGHNGAGKTTTMSIMTGTQSPTSGTVIIDGYDICKNVDEVRQTLGFCPQHDILFSNMTVKQHLLFFAALKRTPKHEIPSSVSRMLRVSGLLSKSGTKPNDLSGGMRRRLSIAIAFVGGSKVVVLDEPTAGVDPGFRRSIWSLIQSEASRTTIFLSTHFMDEADYLGDRIAIMGEGEIYSCGTPLFLKTILQVGYHLTIVKGAEFDAESTLRSIQDIIPNASVERHTFRELNVLLPQDRKPEFPPMFQILEAEKDVLGISSMGITFSGMEDVFLTIDRMAEESLEKSSGEALSTIEDYPFQEKPAGLGVQIRAVLNKKWSYLYHKKNILILQILFPWLIVSITLLYSDIKTKTKGKEEDPDTTTTWHLNLDTFKEVKNILFYDESHLPAAKIFRDIMKEEKYEARLDKQKKPIAKLLMDAAETDLENYPWGTVLGAEFARNGTTFFYNSETNSAGLIAGTYLFATIFRLLTNMTLNFNLELDPSRLRSRNLIDSLLSSNMVKPIAPIAVGLSLSSLAASFLFLPVSERVSKFKRIQSLSGLSLKGYWIGAFLFDFFNFLIVVLPIVALLYFRVYDEPSFIAPLLLLTLTYIPVQLFFVYLLSFGYDSNSTAFYSVYSLYSAGSMLFLVFRLVIQGKETLRELYDIVCTYVPLYTLELGLYNLQNVQAFGCWDETDPCCMKYDGTKLPSSDCPIECFKVGGCRVYRHFYGSQNPVIGNEIRNFCIWIALGPILLCLMETAKTRRILSGLMYYCPCFWLTPCLGPCCHCCPPLKTLFANRATPTQDVINPGSDDDVQREKQRILEGDTKSDIVVLNRLSKRFGKLQAVKDLCLGIPRKECFGLIGVNGSGKTTTFRMLIGDETITEGDAYLRSYSVQRETSKAQRYIGYCPQFGGLINELPAMTIMKYIATLRGYKNANEVATFFAQRLKFEHHAKKPIKKMSGGNQRKVSTAVSMIGSPPILFLDEPTTGMDPIAKRKIWSVLAAARNAGTCIILTSHAMEECEALCTKLGIMVSGEFCCLGSPQHLKNKYATGYTVAFKLFSMDEQEHLLARLRIMDVLNTNFPSSTLKNSEVGAFDVNIPGRWPWDMLFSVLETIAMDPNLYVEDYHLTQASLDDIFCRLY